MSFKYTEIITPRATQCEEDVFFISQGNVEPTLDKTKTDP